MLVCPARPNFPISALAISCRCEKLGLAGQTIDMHAWCISPTTHYLWWGCTDTNDVICKCGMSPSLVRGSKASQSKHWAQHYTSIDNNNTGNPPLRIVLYELRNVLKIQSIQLTTQHGSVFKVCRQLHNQESIQYWLQSVCVWVCLHASYTATQLYMWVQATQLDSYTFNETSGPHVMYSAHLFWRW